VKTIRTHVDVDAPRSAVWAILTDLSSYPEWNPHVIRAEGDLRAGADLTLRVRRAGVRDREMTVRVADLQPERRLEWVGTVLSPLVFRGRHTFELESRDGGGTRLHNVEEVSGLLAPLVVTDDPERDYETMNEALKARAETRPDRD
jgi:hypothetical protein